MLKSIFSQFKALIIIRIITALMNKISISKVQNPINDASTLVLSYEDANKMLPILRSDHFRSITLGNISEVEPKNLKFLIQLGRLLKADGSVGLQGGDNKELTTLLSRLGLHEGRTNGEETVFLKSKPQEQSVAKKEKLAIGFKSNQAEEQIDESELLEGENIDLAKKKGQSCSTKVRACANCSCGRKENQTNVSKEQLVKSINEGQPIAGCGKCSMGDSFRCGTCPYKGLPAFKPGDKLKLMEEGGVIVQQSATKVSATGKVKLEL